MLQTIRDKITGWVAGLFLGAIAVVFVFWGIDFQSTSASFAAKKASGKLGMDVRRGMTPLQGAPRGHDQRDGWIEMGA